MIFLVFSTFDSYQYRTVPCSPSPYYLEGDAASQPKPPFHSNQPQSTATCRGLSSAQPDYPCLLQWVSDLHWTSSRRYASNEMAQISHQPAQIDQGEIADSSDSLDRSLAFEEHRQKQHGLTRGQGQNASVSTSRQLLGVADGKGES